MKQAVTLKSLAKELSLSISAVSKALRNDPEIGPATTDRVRQLAELRNYVPNPAASHLKQRRNFKIGVIIPDLFDQFFALALRGIEDTAAENKYAVIFTQTQEQPDREQALIETMIRNRVDGLLLAVTTQTDTALVASVLESAGIPLVFCVRSATSTSAYSVSADSRAGSRQAVDYLIGRGHRRIAHLCGPVGLISHRNRYDGYADALLANHLPLDPDLVQPVDFTAFATTRAMNKLLALPDPPTAILSVKNYVTLDVISFLQRERPDLLNQLDLIGFGDLPLLRHIDYRPLAAVDADPVLLGAEAFRLLHHRMTHDTDLPPADRQRRMSCSLTVY